MVEEILRRRVSVLIGAWPGVDRRGRLLFHGAIRTVSVDVYELEDLFGDQRQLAYETPIGNTDAVRRRRVTVGDVFAASPGVALSQRGRLPSRPAEVLAAPIWDITAQAREAAHASANAAVAPTLSREEASRLLQVPGEQPEGTDEEDWARREPAEPPEIEEATYLDEEEPED